MTNTDNRVVTGGNKRSISQQVIAPQRLIIGGAIIVAALCWQQRVASAQGFTIPEMGARVNGMGAAIGRPDDLSAIYHNPAALTMQRGTQTMLSFGAVFLNTDIRMAPWAGSDAYITEPVDAEGYYPRTKPTIFAVIPMLAVSTNLWSEKVVGALGVYVPNAAGASFGDTSPARYHATEALLVSLFTTLAVAYQPWSWLSIGVGASATYIRISAKNKLYPKLGGADLSSVVGGDTEMEIAGDDVQPVFHFGLMAWPHRTVSLGFVMLSRYDVSLEGPINLKPNGTPGFVLKKLIEQDNRHRTTVIAPWIFGGGINWDVTPWLEMGAEFRFYRNSLVKEQRTTITSGAMLGGLLPDGLVTPKNNSDSFHTGGGFIVRPPWDWASGLDFMTGIHYLNSSAPDNTVSVATPSFDIWAWHLGARWRINKNYRATLTYAHYWYLRRTTTDSITEPPTNFTGTGFSNVISLVLEAQVARGIGIPAAEDEQR